MATSSKRGRRRYVQQELFRNGGKRKGAGRKPKGRRAGSPHRERPAVKASQALHVVLRVVPEVGNLRRRKMYKAMREATIVAAVRERIRIVQISLQRTHVHLLVFPDWQELADRATMWPIRAGYDPLVVRRPQSWLLREGWLLAGGAISAREVPGLRR